MAVKISEGESVEEPVEVGSMEIEVGSMEFSNMAGDKVLEMHRRSQGNDGNKKSLERAITRDKELRRIY